MGKLRVLSATEVCKILEQYGFVQVRQRGSHIIMQKKLPDIVVPVRPTRARRGRILRHPSFPGKKDEQKLC